MKKTILITLLGFWVGVWAVIPCRVQADEKVIKNSGDAILFLNALETNQEKVRYLLDQGRKFIDEQKYKDARETAQFILNNLDPKSIEAKDLLKEAMPKEKISEMPQMNPITIPIGK